MSVKCIQWFCERLDFIRIVHNRNLKLYSRLCCSPNDVVSQCFNWLLYSNEFRELSRHYDVIVEPNHLKFNVLSVLSTLSVLFVIICLVI